MSILSQARKLAVPAEISAETFYQQLAKAIRPEYKKVTDKTIAALKDKPVSSELIRQLLGGSKVLSGLQEADISALVFYVMMQLAQAAREDITSIMEDITRANEQKKQLRENLRQQQELNQQTLGRQYRPVGDIAAQELSEMEQLRLQMAMQRQQQLLTMLSNMLKKISDTRKTIIQNLK